VSAPRQREDRGSAVVEFVTLGVLLLIPLIYLVVTVGRLQAAAFATDAAARAAGRAFATAPDERSGRILAANGVRMALTDEGFPVDPGSATEITCAADPCLTPAAMVTVRVSVDVVLPGIPAVVDRLVATHVRVRSSYLATVDRFRDVP
jgi:hypothetical protein